MIQRTILFFFPLFLFTTYTFARFPQSLYLPSKAKPNPINPNFTYVEVNRVNTTALNIPYPGEFYTGYITVNETSGAKLFYQLYAAGGNLRANATVNDSAPLFMPLPGGPGCPAGNSFYESGPFRVDNVNGTYTPVLNEVTWNDEYHLLYIDNPVGVGYSVENNDMPAFASSNGVYLVNFLKRFFELFPNLKKQSFYPTGESYGGHYVLGLTNEILKNPDLGIKLTGVGFQDGWFDPYWQGTFWGNAWYSIGFIDANGATEINNYIYSFQQAIQAQDYALAFMFVAPIEGLLPDGFDPSEYRNNSQWDPATQDWLNLNSTKQYLAADPNTNWGCMDLREYYYLDFTQSYASNATDLLSNHNVSLLFYQGQEDFLVPATGTQTSLDNFNWTHIHEYKTAKNKVWKDNDGNVIGHYKHSDKLTFALVNKAGHNAAHDQPWTVKNAIDRWVHNKWE